eukprot:TRINITY_DN15270_c0_g1_i8.p1 TRINITY_DN15270_c0_g1~~TRINITY_DN15270_c0_g1_i8.p1  ORF type:complete len:1344 (+),score=258.10 TRINITY_DN15270_c0_g1_i8:57-4088(+)
MVLDACSLLATIVSGGGDTCEPDDYQVSSDERHVALLSGWVDFYIRRLYRLGEDCWNRPVRGRVGATVAVIQRTRDQAGHLVHSETTPTQECLNLGSYNYLGFAGQDEYCTPAAEQAVFEHGVASCSPPCELGANKAIDDLEKLIREFLGGTTLKEAALVFGMGFATNSHTIPALMGKGSLILSDALNHTSIVEGCRSSGAKVKAFKHNDPGDLERLLYAARLNGQPNGEPYTKILVIVEGVYSMEGEMCLLNDIVDVKNKYGAYLYLDEAHSIGAMGSSGRGVCERLGVDPAEVDIMMGTLTKSFGSFGGYIAANHEVIHTLRNKSASCLYSNGMSPPCAIQAQRALELILGRDDEGNNRGQQKIAQLRENSLRLYNGLCDLGCIVLGPGDSPVIPIMIYHPTKMFEFSRECLHRGIASVVVGFPATPVLLSRARFCVSASHTVEQIDAALVEIGQVVNKLGLKYSRVQHEVQTQAFDISHKSIEDLAEWIPEPLAPRTTKQDDPFRPSARQLEKVDVQLSTYDFLGLAKHAPILAASAKVIRDFGVGSCGPRGFYGTLEHHLELEHAISNFMGTESAILYSFGTTTVSSVIPAFAKPGDVLVMDDGINYHAQTGAALSKAQVIWFKHNDMADLEHKLMALECEDGLLSARLTKQAVRRRFLVTEGIFANSGDLSPLVDIVELKRRHALRLILDDSLGIGVLGQTGRGSLEHWGLSSNTAEILVGSLETCCAAAGGFCCGSETMIHHQRLSGAGYVFSASLPPFLCTAASEALACMDAEPDRRERLIQHTKILRSGLSSVDGLEVAGALESPMMFVRWPGATALDLDRFAQDLMESKRIAVTQARHCPLQASEPLPALRVCVSARLTQVQVERVCKELVQGLTHEIKKSQSVSQATLPRAPNTPITRSQRGAKTKLTLTKSNSLIFDHTESQPLEPSGALQEQEGCSADQIQSVSAGRQHVVAQDVRKEGCQDPGLVGSVPLVQLVGWILQGIRNYLEHQVTWGSNTTLMTLSKLRNPVLDGIMLLFSVIGSEYIAIPVCFWLAWNDSPTIARMMLTLYVVVVYIGSLVKNVFCLKRPAGAGNSDFGWPSIHCMAATSLPFFLLRCTYGKTWLWEQQNPVQTFLVFGFVFLYASLVITARLYFGRSSPADVQAGCFMGAGILRIWLNYAAIVDKAVLNAVSPWPLMVLSALLLVVHPVPRRQQLGPEHEPFLNDTYILTVRVLGLGTGYLAGYIGPAVMVAAPQTIPSSMLVAYIRWSVGLTFLMGVAYCAHKIQLSVTQGILKIFTKSETKKLGVNVNLRNGIRVIGWWSVAVLVGLTASWGLPHGFLQLDRILRLLPFQV